MYNDTSIRAKATSPINTDASKAAGLEGKYKYVANRRCAVRCCRPGIILCVCCMCLPYIDIILDLRNRIDLRSRAGVQGMEYNV